ncbi:MAG: 50S ribosomal protein L22 [bacterium]
MKEKVKDTNKKIQKNTEVEKSAKVGSDSVGRKVIARYGDANSSPQKMRLVAALIRRKDAVEAVNILTFTSKKAAKTLLKVLKSAIANADNRYSISPEKLVVSGVDIGEGVKLPRFRFASRGRISKLMKRRSLIKIELTEK